MNARSTRQCLNDSARPAQRRFAAYSFHGRRSTKPMLRISTVVLVSALCGSGAAADVRHTSFPSALLGTWAETAEQCAANDKSNVSIAPTTYGDAQGSCTVRWIVETAGSQGVNYAVHSLCTSASQPTKTQLVNIVIRPEGADRAAMGRSFTDLKTYQRCPAP